MHYICVLWLYFSDKEAFGGLLLSPPCYVMMMMIAWLHNDQVHVTHRTKPHQTGLAPRIIGHRCPKVDPSVVYIFLVQVCLKLLRQFADTVLSSREFQNFITLSEKKCCCKFEWTLFFISLNERPLVLFSESRVNMESEGISDKPLCIL